MSSNNGIKKVGQTGASEKKNRLADLKKLGGKNLIPGGEKEQHTFKVALIRRSYGNLGGEGG